MNGKIYVYFNRAKYEKEGIAKYYVGQTIRELKDRCRDDLKGYAWHLGSDTKFANSIRKWGPDAFEQTLLEDNIKTQEELDALEIFYIEYFDSFKNGYNSTTGGAGTKNYEMNEEARKKCSRPGELNGMYGKKGELNPNYGKKRSEETTKKISIGVKKSRAEKGNPFKGHKHTEECKNKIGKTVECKELKELGYEYHFTRIGLAEEYVKSTFNINVKRITEVCNGVQSYCGTLKINGQKIRLTWKFV